MRSYIKQKYWKTLRGQKFSPSTVSILFTESTFERRPLLPASINQNNDKKGVTAAILYAAASAARRIISIV